MAQAKREHIAILWDMYRKAVSKSDKGRILTQICEVLGMHRKSAIRLLRKKSVPCLQRSAAPRANRIPDSMSGTFAWTVTATDILSNWTDIVTIWGKNSDAVCLALKIMEKRSPIKWKAICVDNGIEFVKETIEAYFSKPNEKRLLKGF